MFVYDNATIRLVRKLSQAGESDYTVAKKTGIARQTIMRWRHRGFPEREEPSSSWTVAPPEYSTSSASTSGMGVSTEPGARRSTRSTSHAICDIR